MCGILNLLVQVDPAKEGKLPMSDDKDPHVSFPLIPKRSAIEQESDREVQEIFSAVASAFDLGGNPKAVIDKIKELQDKCAADPLSENVPNKSLEKLGLSLGELGTSLEELLEALEGKRVFGEAVLRKIQDAVEAADFFERLRG